MDSAYLARVGFVRLLPQLTSFSLCQGSGDEMDLHAARVSISHHCAQLTSLAVSLDGSHRYLCTSEQMAEYLRGLPLLRSLHLADLSLHSLSFLAAGLLPSTLTSLTLQSCIPHLPLSELDHIRSLQTLQLLSLHDVFDTPLESLLMQNCRLPSAVLPSLRQLKCT